MKRMLIIVMSLVLTLIMVSSCGEEGAATPTPTLPYTTTPTVRPSPTQTQGYLPHSTYAGTYVRPADPSEYLQLNEDGTFYAHQRGNNLSGTWDIHEWSKTRDKLVFHMSVDSYPAYAMAWIDKEGRRIDDNEGKIWIKQSSG